jgi:hypothetical protein
MMDCGSRGCGMRVRNVAIGEGWLVGDAVVG